ncbi:MAG: hypothetical protein HYY12_07520 [Candidatus Methylomirabilis oxyfera]|nr:hypothetical protein [Candidatus Methylomirabilis oxyfera]
MRLWGRVVSGSLLVIGAVFATASAAAPEARAALLAAAAISVGVALMGVPWIVRLFMSITGDEGVLENGLQRYATITKLQPTAWRYNRYYPVVRFGLSVELSGSAYPVEIRQTVAPDVLERLALGTVVGVRVDPSERSRVVIDWRQPIKESA